MYFWFYYRDPEGIEWGPFTPAQLTSLLNRGVLGPDSRIRPEGEEKWYRYYKCPREIPRRMIEEGMTKEEEKRMGEGQRICERLWQHVLDLTVRRN